MVLYDKWLCWRLLLYVLLILDLLETIHFCKMLLAQWSFHSNNSTGNENVTASPALDYSAIVLDWQTMFAQDEIMIQLIHSWSLHRAFEVRPTQTKSTGGKSAKTDLAKLKKMVFKFLFSLGQCEDKFFHFLLTVMSKWMVRMIWNEHEAATSSVLFGPAHFLRRRNKRISSDEVRALNPKDLC